MRLLRPALRAFACTGVAAAALLMASPASAHVTVDSPDAAPGGFGKVVFRVPTESETASTRKVTVDLPEDTPFAFVSSQAKPGWTASMKKTKHDKPVKVGEFNLTETVSEVTWTARKGHAVEPGEFDEFALSVGPFPDDPGAGVTFHATQTYSDGSTVVWDDPAPESGKEAEHPAPTLKLADSTGQNTTTSRSDAESSEAGESGDPAALSLAVAGLVVALAALVLAARAQRGRR